jgi:tetratricopeptide (TPR) repeat protein/transcriptional regulator with XRE-family HTH domain
LAYELTQDEVAARFNQVRDDLDGGMRGSRICEYEKWPMGGVRPSVRILKILATVYNTTWDRLVDVDDLDQMPAIERREFLDISNQRYGTSLNLPIPRQRRYYPSLPHHGGDSQANRPVTGKESLALGEQPTAASSESPSERPGGVLPAEITHFTGRDQPMAELRAGLDEQAPQGTVVTIYAIDGMAGVGKTAFARHAAQKLAERYPDGAIWVDLYGHTPGMVAREPSGALEQMLLQLGMPPEAIKADLTERQDQWRRHIHFRRMLIVLDNALTSDQVLPLLPEAPGCLVLITSRRKLTGLTDAYPLSLDVLEWEDAERLFIKLVGDQRCDDRGAIRQILAACGRLPLAIRLIAGRLRHHRGELLADVAADFADQAAALDTLVAEHLSVRAAFEWSYRLLTDAQRRAFRLLGWHPGPEITLVVIVAVAAVSPAQGKQLLRELVDQNLLDQLPVTGTPGGPRYRMHDLVRLYARERADAEEPPVKRTTAVDRLTRSYLGITHEADQLLGSHISGDPDKNKNTAQKTATVLALADAGQARTWLTAERHNLLSCVQAMSPTAEAADLAKVLAVHFQDFGFWSDTQYLYNQALTIYRYLGDRFGETYVLCGLGRVKWLVGEYRRAREYYTQALTLARQLGFRCAEIDALQGLGEVERLVGEYGQARDYHTQALTLARKLGFRRAEVDALWELSEVERLIGEYGRAREYHTQALHLARHLNDRPGEVGTLRGMGEVEWLVGDYGQARDYHTQALHLTRQLGDRRGEVDALRGLGRVEWLLGAYRPAREYYTQALVLARKLGDQRSEVLALWGLGEVERLVGDYGQARDYYTQTLVLARKLGDRRGEVLALRGLGQIQRLVGDYGEARDYHTQALTLARKLGYRFGQTEALRGLGQLERLVGDYEKARDYHTQALTLARKLGDRPSEVDALRGLGHAERLAGEYAQARKYYTQAVTISRHLGDQGGEGLAIWGLGQVERLIGEYGQAREYCIQALAITRQLGFRRGEVDALQGLGQIERLAGEYRQARNYHTQALAIARQLGFRRGELDALQGLNEAERLAGEYERAREYHTQALTLAKKLGDRSGEMEVASVEDLAEM